MAALDAPRKYSFGGDPQGVVTFPASSLTIQEGSMIGMDRATGNAIAWVGAAGDEFLGLAVSATSSASSVRVATYSRQITGYAGSSNGKTGGVNVTGSTAATDQGDPVYSSTDNLEDLTLTATAGPQIGVVLDWISGTQCTIRLQPSGVAAGGGGAGGYVDLDGLAGGLILDADGDTTIGAPTDDQIDVEIAGADDFTFTANTFTALAGSTVATDTLHDTSGTAVACTTRMTITDDVTSGTARVIGGRASALVAAGAAHANSTSEAVLASYSIPADTLKAGSILRFEFLANATSTDSSDTLQLRIRCGPTTLVGTALWTGAAVDATNADICAGMGVFNAREAPSATAACTFVGQIMDVDAAGSGTIAMETLGTGGAGADFATNGILLFELTADWSVALTANSVRAEIFNVTIT